MGGGGSGSSFQTPVSSGTYGPLSFSDQTTATSGGGYDWGSLIKGLGQGAQGVGKGLAKGETPVPGFQETQLQEVPIDSGQYQPSVIQLDPRIIQALARVLGGR